MRLTVMPARVIYALDCGKSIREIAGGSPLLRRGRCRLRIITHESEVQFPRLDSNLKTMKRNKR